MITTDAEASPDDLPLDHLGLVDRADLDAVVSASLGTAATVESVAVQESPYDLDALTTESRQRVRGRAATADGDRPFSFFVKVVRSWRNSPAFAEVPEVFRAQADLLLPWQVEPATYRSPLRDVLPAGLQMPRAYAVRDLGPGRCALWLEDVPADPTPWPASRYLDAAAELGRFAVDPDVTAAVAEVLPLTEHRTLRAYAEGRVGHVIAPQLASTELWQHPLVAAHFTPYRDRLLTALDALPGWLTELDSLPTGLSHGDACPRNLLVRPGEQSLTMIDFGFLGPAPLGFDLSQLLLGEVQLDERPAAQLPALLPRCLRAYAEAARAVDPTLTVERLARAQALAAMIFSGVSAIPFERLGDEPTDAASRFFAARAELARVLLDQVDATA